MGFRSSFPEWIHDELLAILLEDKVHKFPALTRTKLPLENERSHTEKTWSTCDLHDYWQRDSRETATT
ncbi:hypothetical protein NDU88_006097 [Pleurodeles waltl]|uniref:Uncharacterized protein n=1 Tax=Pleurodeles waltl TaxID=8319 RepID=A0AAV7SNN6_PLEWA|nr:hypothetical protein NDU88_006097 [Pleurodeles waltl]